MRDRVPQRIQVAAVALLAMMLLAPFVTADNWLTRADLDLVEAAARERSAAFTTVAEAVSWLGNVLLLGTLATVTAIALRWRGAEWSRVLLPAGALAAAAILDPLAKLAVGRPRPPAELAEIVESATGYPSGHSAQAMAFWLALAWALSSGPGSHRRTLQVSGVVILLVGLSRIVLGVHSPTDVIGGWCLGLACALVAIELVARRSQEPRSAPARR